MKLIRMPIIVAMLLVGLVIGLLQLLLPSPTPHAVGMFGRVDVLLCAVVCAIPLSKLIADKLASGTRLRSAAIAVGLVAVVGMVLTFVAALSLVDASGELSLVLWRGLVVIPAVTAVLLLCSMLFGRQPAPELGVPVWVWSLTLIALALVVPAAYADAVAESLRTELQQSLDGERLALAKRQADELRQLKPHWTVHDAPIQKLQRELGQAVDQLRSEAAEPLPTSATLPLVGRRITVLVQLGRYREALHLARPLTQGEHFHPIALDYCGLCYQRLEQPRESLEIYRRAIDYWDTQPTGNAQRRGLASALKGVAFAARRLENRTLEEQTYQRLVEVDPSAESHFLLAQCYREHQKTSLAAAHAATAIELDPRYQEQAAGILSSLSRDHFGCLQVPR